MASRRRQVESVDTNGPSTSGRSKRSSSLKLESSTNSHIKDHAYTSPQSSHSRAPSASPVKSHRKEPSTRSSTSSRGKQPSASTSKMSSSKNDKPSTSKSKTNGETSTKTKIENSSNESTVANKPSIAPRKPRQSAANVPMFSPRKTRRQVAKLNLKLPQLDGAGDIPKKGTKRTNAKDQKKVKDESDASSDDSDFEPSPPKRVRPKLPTKQVKKRRQSATKANTSKQLDRRVLSDEDDPEQEVPNTERMDFWIEAYAEKEKKWIVIDPVKKKVDSIDHVRVSGINLHSLSIAIIRLTDFRPLRFRNRHQNRSSTPLPGTTTTHYVT